MSVDIKNLEVLAKAATPGRVHDRLDSCGGGLKYECFGDDGSLVLKVDHKNDEWGFVGERGEQDEAFFLACTPAAVLELITELKQTEEDNVTWKGGISALGEALKKLTLCARTVTDGPDQALMDACDAAENALSLGGVSRAIDYIEGLKSENKELKEKYEVARDRKNSIIALKAELAGLKTGYEAYERVNAELRAECEAMRSKFENPDPILIQCMDSAIAEQEQLENDAKRYRWLRDGAGYCDTRDIPGMAPARMDAFIDAAMSKEQSHD